MKQWMAIGMVALLGSAVLTAAASAEEVKVMTRNLYLGASLDAALGAQSIAEIPGIVAETWAAMIAVDFPGRAKVLADEIAAARPHLVGLQEVWLFRT